MDHIKNVWKYVLKFKFHIHFLRHNLIIEPLLFSNSRNSKVRTWMMIKVRNPRREIRTRNFPGRWTSATRIVGIKLYWTVQRRFDVLYSWRGKGERQSTNVFKKSSRWRFYCALFGSKSCFPFLFPLPLFTHSPYHPPFSLSLISSFSQIHK